MKHATPLDAMSDLYFKNAARRERALIRRNVDRSGINEQRQAGLEFAFHGLALRQVLNNEMQERTMITTIGPKKLVSLTTRLKRSLPRKDAAESPNSAQDLDKSSEGCSTAQVGHEDRGIAHC